MVGKSPGLLCACPVALAALGRPESMNLQEVPVRMTKWTKLPALALAVGLFATACSSDGDDTSTPDENVDAGSQSGDASGATLAAVTDRGTLVCGVSGQLPGFSAPDANGVMQGFDADYCRAIAAAVLGDAEAVEFRELTAQERFTALQSGEIDVLVRNTTATATRDGVEGVTFQTTTFYDGQGFMVPADSDIETIEDMAGATICVLSGTTTELNLSSVMGARGIDFEPLTFADNNQLFPAFEAGQCDAMTTDKSGLAGLKSGSDSEFRILAETISKEPLGPGTRDGDAQWDQIVQWVVFGTFTAEELGINSGNIDSFMDSDDPEIQRLLGLTTEDGTVFDSGLGLPGDWLVNIIKSVGNYGEIYERHVGENTPLGLTREGSLNALWTEGGLHYPWPFR